MSLERRADSAGSPRVNSGFSVPPLSRLSRDEAKDLIYSFFDRGAFSFANISSTINKTGNGFAELSEDGEKAGTKIGGSVGDLLSLGTVAQNIEEAIKLLVGTVASLVKIFDALKTIMSKSESGRTIYDDISSMMESLAKFIAEQQNLHDKITQHSKLFHLNNDPPNPPKL
ncbi:hypothetical protein BASA61_009725 [Batrachochytrium salamandrivorans]|nr:hypothetical protein BASA61_009725 [Batrachochytrium salamandrivorans]